LPGTIGFFEKDVPAAFVDASDSATKAAFSESNAAAIAALREYEKWLQTDLLPRSLRRVLAANTNVEGCAHYSEQNDAR
jgi:hypothetical protein